MHLELDANWCHKLLVMLMVFSAPALDDKYLSKH